MSPATASAPLPVIVIGAGPVGLAAAAHLLERGLEPLVLEAGDAVAAAVRAWSHVRLFSPWQYDVDAAARRLLATSGWTEPSGTALPTGAELVRDYLEPLATTTALRDRVVLGARVVAVSRDGFDKTHTRGRSERPFLVRAEVSGEVVDVRARAVIDASGTWSQPNPLGTAGLPAAGERDVADLVLGPLPDVLGRHRARVAGKHVAVVGSGHSAVNTLLALVELRRTAPRTRISWLVRSPSAERTYGGGDADGLPARGRLGAQLRAAVAAGDVDLHLGATVSRLARGDGRVRLTVGAAGREEELVVDAVVRATGFRPDLAVLREVRLDLDPGLEAPRRLAPLIDPEHHSCGTVRAHGAQTLAHPETGFFIAGTKSYGRAPTFLLATGYEQVRSIAAHLAGDDEAAGRVDLVLPHTGVCSTAAVANGDRDCCDGSEPRLIGVPTGLAHGR